ncbi:hypothetical protein K3495_g4480 [Podosphaera aphanis]|nr:hypothetical protein K3495_g4480 [Podosphaera aphanis]
MEPVSKDNSLMNPSVVIWTHLQDPDRSRLDRLDRSHPRVPVSSSMLYAHALMRGSIYNENSELGDSLDPLYYALFNGRHRKYANRADLPRNGRSDSIESLNKEIKFYWDPILSTSYQDQEWSTRGILPYLDISSPSVPIDNCPRNLTYEEFCQRNPIFIGMNHYKGDAVYANFGYLRIGELWVDPDSAAEVNEALLILQGEPSKPSSILGPPLSIDRGPHIMSDSESNSFYQKYLEYVMEDIDIYGNIIDQEGDPRISRISPETFIMWAAGAKFGDCSEKTSNELPATGALNHGGSIDRTQLPKRLKTSLSQYDHETGSRMSDILSLSSDPSVLWSAPGVKSVYAPLANFAYSYPHIQAKFIREAYVKGWVSNQLNDQDQTELSSLVEEVYTTEVCQRHLETLCDGKGGRDVYTAIQASLQKIRDEGVKMLHQVQQTLDKARLVSEQKGILMQQVFYLQRLADQVFNSVVDSGCLHQVKDISPPERCHSPKIKLSCLAPASLSCSSILHPPSPPISPSPLAIPTLELPSILRLPSAHSDLSPRERVFVRHLREQFCEEIGNVGQIRDQNKFVAHKCKQIEAATKFWARKRDLLLASLDIKHVDQFPGLIPLKPEGRES